jgi:hypothetical protein
MAHVRSTARYIGGGAGGGSSGEGHESRGSMERTESAQQSDAGSRSEAGDMVDGSWSFFFGPLTMTVSQINGMIDNNYFAEGMCREPGEETILEPNLNAAVVF